MKDNRLNELRKKMNDAIMHRQYTKVAKIQKQIQTELARKENVSLKSLLPHMTQEQTESSLMKMHKVFVIADLLYGYALDFENDIRKYDPSMETHVFRKVKEIAKVSREITKNVDDFHCDRFSENFGMMCDECSMVIENIIYKYRQREKKEIEEQKKQKES